VDIDCCTRDACNERGSEKEDVGVVSSLEDESIVHVRHPTNEPPRVREG
jgi:hypothetical protein